MKHDGEEDKKIVKDMTIEFNTQVSDIQKEIDIIKKEILFDKTQIPRLNERIHALSIKIFNKMTEGEQKRQMYLKHKLNNINIGKVKPIESSDGTIKRVFIINPKNYRLFAHFIEKREIHINQILERIGLSAKDIKKKRRVY